MRKREQRRRRLSFRKLLVTIVAVFAVAFVAATVQAQNIRADEGNASQQTNADNADFVYLSDLKAEKAKVGWGSLGLDKASDGSKIAMRIENTVVTLDKGIFAHASSELIYNVGDLGFDYFTAYVGLNKSSTGGNGVKFTIYTSDDQSTWDLVDCGLPAVSMPGTNATFVKVDIRDKKYLRLVANDNGANGQDHSVYGDAKLIKAGYTDNVVSSVEEFDEEIRELYKKNNGRINDELELRILQRDLVQKTGQYQLRQLFAEGEEYENAFKWVFNNLDILRLYTMGGQLDGTYKMSFETLAKLLVAHGEDLKATGTTSAHNIPLSEVYTKMMITLALTHSRVVNFWVYGQPGYTGAPVGNISDPVWRYEIYKEQLLADRLNGVFDTLEVEEMRLVLSSQINDDEVKWARDYAVGVKGGAFGAYAYTPYRNVNTALYRQDAFYADDISFYQDKYVLAGYDVRVMPKYPRLWMVMEVGGVCWQLSNVGSNMVQAMGVPAILIGQPSHSAYLTYGANAKGQSVWAIQNNVGGWQVANIQAYNGSRGYFAQRLPMNWGNGSYKRSNVTVSYVTLSSAALDDYDNFGKAEVLVRLANATTDTDERIAIYREALKTQPINFDAWLGLVQTYNTDDNKTADDRTELAQQIVEKLKFYPMPMSDLLRQLKTKIADAGHIAMMTRIEQDALNAALKVTNNDVAQPDVTTAIARLLLGQLDTEIATFSFDGEDAGKIKLASRLDNAAFEYKLSEDDEWQGVTDTSVTLSEEELARITSSYGIKIHIVGMNYEDVNIHSIDIQDGLKTANLYANDRENAVIGVHDTMEWKLDGTNNWVGYDVEKPDLTGDKGISVRYKASGTRLAGASEHFTFSADVDDPKHHYIPISNLSIYDFSSENIRSNRNEYEYASNAIDGNINTYWHTLRTAVDPDKRLTIELASDEYISRVEYVPVPNYKAGIMKTAILSFSTDGENFERYEKIICDDNYTGQTCTDGVSDTLYYAYDTRFTPHSFDLEESVKAKYVRIEYTSTWDSKAGLTNDGFASIAMLNLYEDSTKSPLPRFELHYSTHDITNDDVTVQLVNPTPENAVVFDNGDTYTFIQNGEYTFKYHNDLEAGEIVARVDWIDKVKPVANVSYTDAPIPINDNGDKVNGIKATITFLENVEILDFTPIEVEGVVKGYKIGDGEELILNEDGTLIHYFKFNHSFTLRFRDAAGNEGSAEVKVDSLTANDGQEDNAGSDESGDNSGNSGDTGGNGSTGDNGSTGGDGNAGSDDAGESNGTGDNGDNNAGSNTGDDSNVGDTIDNGSNSGNNGGSSNVNLKKPSSSQGLKKPSAQISEGLGLVNNKPGDKKDPQGADIENGEESQSVEVKGEEEAVDEDIESEDGSVTSEEINGEERREKSPSVLPMIIGVSTVAVGGAVAHFFLMRRRR